MRMIRSAVAMAVLVLSLGAQPSRADVTLGGWVGLALYGDTRPGSKPGLDVHPWYFNVQAEPIQDVKVFGELEMEHVFEFAAGEVGAGELKLERLYVEKTFSSAHNIRGGKTFMPFGYWYRLHWGFLTETVSKPFSFDNAYAPESQVGVHYYGRLYKGNAELSYYAWLGNGPDVVDTNLRTVAEPGFGGSIFATYAFDGRDDLSVGITLASHTQWVASAERGTLRQDNAVMGVEAKLVRVDLRGEFYWHHTSAGGLKNTLYGSGVFWALPRLGVLYRFDWGDDEKHTQGLERAWSHSFGLLWRPHAAVVVKAEVRLNQFHDAAIPSFWQGTAAIAVKY